MRYAASFAGVLVASFAVVWGARLLAKPFLAMRAQTAGE